MKLFSLGIFSFVSEVNSSEFCVSYQTNNYKIDYSYQQNLWTKGFGYDLIMALIIDKEYWILKLNQSLDLYFDSTDGSTSDWFGNGYKLGISVEKPSVKYTSFITGLLKVLLIL